MSERLRQWLCGLALAATAGSAAATTWYVRPDGGSAAECSGRADAPRGSGEDCAWSHPFIALPPAGEPRIAGGDTLRIAPGSYRMGLGAPGAQACAPEWAWDCHMPPIPSGPSADRPTVISGGGTDGACDTKARPELWGSERSARVVNLEGSSNVALRCLEITDHGSCVEHHCHGGNCEGEVAACSRDAPPFGDWAGTGVYARDSRNVSISDVDVHGLAVRGFHVGGARDWRLERVRIIGNGWSGWDGDLGEGDSANAGTLRFVDVEIAWNGCAERWPDGGHFGCWAQQTGGYGDGLGTASTGGHWIFEGGSVHHNTSDGLDLLYLEPGGRVEIEGLRAFANAGNQVKTSGDATLVDSDIDGSCGYFADGEGLSKNMLEGDHCRALGNAVVVAVSPGAKVELRGNRIGGNGDCLVVAEGGDSDAEVRLVDNSLQGGPRFTDRSEQPCGFYAHQSDARVVRRNHRARGVR